MTAGWRISGGFSFGTTAGSSRSEKKSRQIFHEQKPASVRDSRKSVKAVVNTELAKDAHEAKMEKYGEKLLDCDNNYSRACATIWLNFEDGVRVHIKGVDIPPGRV